jgi:spore coat protein SA
MILPELLPVPPVQGGAVEHWVDEIVRRYPSDDVEITIFSRPAGVAGQPGVRYIGVPWTATETRAKALRDWLGSRHPLSPLLKIQNVWSYGRRVVTQLAGYDIVCIQNEPNLLAMLRRRPGQRVVLHMHNDHLIARAFRPLYARALGKADRVVCVSNYICRRAAAAFPQHEDRFGVVVNGTDPDTFRPRGLGEADAPTALLNRLSGKRVIFYAGRLVEQKGVHVLIAAFSRVAADDPAVTLVIAGSSFFAGATMTDYQRGLAASAGAIGDRIVFTGFVPHSTLKHLYARADVVTLPSIWDEPSGLTVLEGMASGAAVVTTKVGGIPELVVDGETAVTVPPDDAGALASAIATLLSDPERRRTMGRAARTAVIDRFNWDRVARDYASEIEGRR